MNGYKAQLLRGKNLDLKTAIQICTTSEVAAQQMIKIQSTEDKAEKVKKLGDKKKTSRWRRSNKAIEKQEKSYYVQNIVVVNNVM